MKILILILLTSFAFGYMGIEKITYATKDSKKRRFEFSITHQRGYLLLKVKIPSGETHYFGASRIENQNRNELFSITFVRDKHSNMISETPIPLEIAKNGIFHLHLSADSYGGEMYEIDLKTFIKKEQNPVPKQDKHVNIEPPQKKPVKKTEKVKNVQSPESPTNTKKQTKPKSQIHLLLGIFLILTGIFTLYLRKAAHTRK